MFKENQDSAEHPDSLIVPGKTFGFLRIFCALYNSVATRQIMFVLLTVKSKYCSYQFPWLSILLLDLPDFCLLLLKHLLSGKWRTCFIWEVVDKNWASAYIYGLGCQLCMKILM